MSDSLDIFFFSNVRVTWNTAVSFVLCAVPETKGKTLEEIEADFQKK